MTLIIGIKCSDGVVIGADGAATLGTGLGQGTARQDVKKLTVVSGRLVVGSSGPVGVTQQYEEVVEQLWSDRKFSGKKPGQAMQILQEAFLECLKLRYQAAQMSVPVVGNNVASQGVLCSTILGITVSHTPLLVHVNHAGNSELTTDDVPFVSIGSGQALADPFLAFIKRVLWAGRAPNRGQAILATIWSLKHAILTNTGGVSEPMQIATIEKQNGDWTARELEDGELEEHRQAVMDAESKLADYFSPSSSSAPETPPTPP